MLKGLFRKIIGDSKDRETAGLQPVVEEINSLEPAFEELSDARLRAKTDDFRSRLAAGESLDDILVPAFAAVREAAKRTIAMRHFDVQLIGGIVLHRGRIAEMRTGEGKTLVATLPLYLNALTGQGVHLVTPNDYLSKVGVQWMGPIYRLLGLEVAVIQSAATDPSLGSFVFDPTYSSADDRFLNLRPITRREAYQADITYGTNNEFGFDYLRDNMARDRTDCVQRGLHYAIIDEVDNILIDEARTPLIISGPAEESSDLYSRFAEWVRYLRRSSPESVEAETPDGDYAVDERTQVVTLTDQGVRRIEQLLPEVGPEESIYDSKHTFMLPYLDNALRAAVTFKRDRDYIVRDGEVIIVDEFTGRLMYGRRFSEGLHQAIEAKEGVEVQRESLTYATITFQNYFRMYDRLAGMTGTAKTEEEEFQQIYDLSVSVLPTNVEYRAMYGDLNLENRSLDQVDVEFAGVVYDGDSKRTVAVFESRNGSGRKYYRRLDLPDRIYANEKAKFRAIVGEIERAHSLGRPVLVGTIAIETSEHLSRLLKRRGIPHRILNAKYHEKEAVIIAQAGRSGAVTIATNMAGRGVDIKLGGDPEGMARDRLRKRGIDLADISQVDWNRALDMLRRGEDVLSVIDEPWAQILVDAFLDCSQDREKVIACGGLHILGTERHDARRIDNQLRGRAGRQGDAGSSRFYISLEDELMRRFGGERVRGMMGRLGVEEDVPIQHSWLDKSIESAQTRVEGYNFDIRKHVLEYDDVVNKQREVIYAQRRDVLEADDLRDQVLRMVREEVSRVITSHMPGPDPIDWDLRGLLGELRTFFPLPVRVDYHEWEGLRPEEIESQLFAKAETGYDDVNRAIGHQLFRQAAQEDVTLALLAQSVDPTRRLIYRRLSERIDLSADGDASVLPLRRLPDEVKATIEEVFIDAYRLIRERQLVLRAVDGLWVRHLTNLDRLREGIGLRAFGQQNPLVSYRKEAHEMYEDLLGEIQQMVARSVYLVPQTLLARPRRTKLQMGRRRVEGETQKVIRRSRSNAGNRAGRAKLGRNDPCWCGSGKKYKNCHMRQDMEAEKSTQVA